MTANTIYDVFLALPEMERQRLIVLVNQHKAIEKKEVKFKRQKNKINFTTQDAKDYLLKNVFKSNK
ncbi:MAG: hypothetical protein GZ091_14135 [Paludibacter sp.]|nr:hypothetical protein [Paludibacter sp.]